MNALRVASLILSGSLLLAFVIPVSSQSGIIVNGAHTVRTVDTGSSSILNNLLGGVQARVVAQDANSLRDFPLSNLPAPFQALLESVSQRIAVQYANSTRPADLITLPTPFQNLLTSVSARIVFQYANGNRQFALAYPRALLNDTVPPIVNNFANAIDGANAKVTWTTDEFALCTLRYGTQPGNYTGAVDEALYAKQHTTTLSNLTIGAIYSVQATCHDQSGNSATSTEFSFGTDKIAPEISAPHNVTTGKTVTVTWQTNEPATTQLHYGSAPGNYSQTADAPGYATTHSLVLNNLAEGAYYAQIISVDQSGNQTVGPEFSFVIDVTPPQVSKISVSGINANNAVVAWETNEPATVVIEFGTQSENYTNSVTAPLGTGKQQFVIPNLAWETTYFVRLRITDSHGNVTTSAEFTLTTGHPVFLPLIRR